ncbi:MAG TPA: hypothetical protein PKD37_05720 [Oligoflexia bacterium]|nr:hypothetical protein [Oligoflexia bacterium]HMP27462.1 hypothetical protein [Oligoflexia bacterium]
MKRKLSFKLTLRALLVCATCLFSSAIAQVKETSFKVPLTINSKELKKAEIVLFNLQRARPFKADISPVDRKESGAYSQLERDIPSALIMNDDLALIFALDKTENPLTFRINNAAQAGSYQLPPLPACSYGSSSKAGVREQFGLVESLVEIRTARREVAQLKMKQYLSGELLSKLNKWEEGFGFKYERLLSHDLPPTELVERIFKLNSAIKKFYLARVKKQAG